MKQFLFLLFVVCCASTNAQFKIHCPGDITDTVTGRCDTILTIPNPTFQGKDASTSISWRMLGATTGFSPTTGTNFVGTKKFNVGPTQITYFMSKPGKADSCSFIVFVRELVPPTISCPANIKDYVSATTCTKNVAVPKPVFGDNCKVGRLKWKTAGATRLTSGDQQFSYIGTKTFNKGVTTVTYTVIDMSGDSTKCSFKITILDTIPPKIRCNQNMISYCAKDSCSKKLTINLPASQVTDNCTGALSVSWKLAGATTKTGTGLSFTQVFSKGVTTVTYIAKDTSGNKDSCSFTVTLKDTIHPLITNCLDTIKTWASGCGKQLSIPALKFTDNCGTPTLKWGMTGATIRSGTGQVGTALFNIGNTLITDTVTDGDGNISLCKTRVMVYDTSHPKITCPATRNDTITNSDCSKLIQVPNPKFSDNCTDSMLLTWKLAGSTTGESPQNGINYIGTRRFSAGTTTAVYFVKDGAKNGSSCMFKVNVIELTPPQISCPSNMNVNGDSCKKTLAVPAPTVFDNCALMSLTWKMSGATTAASPTTGMNYVGTKTFNRGTTTIFYTLKDSSGNRSTCQQNITFTGADPCQSFTGLVSANKEVLRATLYPNPATHGFNLMVRSESTAPVEITIYSPEKRKTEVLRTTPMQVVRFGDKYEKGVYRIEIQQGDKRTAITGVKL